MKRFLPSLLIALMFLSPATSYGVMTVRSYSAAEHYRFYTGSDKDFVGDSYDFSGVGLGSSGHWATLVSDNYFISANHYHPAVGETITFWSTDNLADSSFSYKVTGGKRIGSTDLWVGWFDAGLTVDESIERYSVLTLPNTSSYVGLELYNYGKTHRVGRNVTESVKLYNSAMTAWYDYDNNDKFSVGGDETVLQTGDSGAPSFAVSSSGLALIGIHWLSNRTSISVDTFVPTYYNDINNVLSARGQSLTAASLSSSGLMPMPEPSHFWYLLITSGYFWLQRRRNTSV
ncbi:MAG: hypothetical protein JW764_10495 [Chlorobiaceae bacterium]|nr:hypothetical protein [Chlorobiaceae bacterium]